MSELLTEQEYVKKYMDLYARGNALFLKYNPCTPAPDGSCLRTQKEPYYAEKLSFRCCGGCQHHDEKSGCKAISLACKLWICSMISSKAFARDPFTDQLLNPELHAFYTELRKLNKESYNELYPWPGCREDISLTLERLAILKEKICQKEPQESSILEERKYASVGA